MSENIVIDQEKNKEGGRGDTAVHSTTHHQHRNLSPNIPIKTFEEDKQGQGLALLIEENPQKSEKKVSFEELRDLGDNSEMKVHTAFNEFRLINLG